MLSEDSEPWVLIPGIHRLACDLGQAPVLCLASNLSVQKGNGSQGCSHRDIAAFHSPDAADSPVPLLDVGVGSITLPFLVYELEAFSPQPKSRWRRGLTNFPGQDV